MTNVLAIILLALGVSLVDYIFVKECDASKVNILPQALTFAQCNKKLPIDQYVSTNKKNCWTIELNVQIRCLSNRECIA